MTGAGGLTRADAAGGSAGHRVPFDVVRGDDVGVVEFVALTLFNRCMTSAGHPQPEARRLGFGVDTAGSAAYLWTLNEHRCDADAGRRIGTGAQTTYLAYNDLVNQLAPYRQEVDRRVPARLRVAVQAHRTELARSNRAITASARTASRLI